MIILTGAAGFLGKTFLGSISDTVLHVEVDECFDFIGQFSKWDEISLILHQGAISSTTEDDWQKLMTYNVHFSISLFEKAIRFGIPVKYASSASVYCSATGGLMPRTLYAQSKLLIDEWVMSHKEDFTLVQGFRYFNVYGEHEDHKIQTGQASPVTQFLHDANVRGEIRVFEGSENFLRDFVYAGDVTSIVMNNNETSGIYDLGTCNPMSFMDVAKAIASRTKARIVEVPFPENLKYGYQTFTCSSRTWNHDFLKLEEYLDGHRLD